MRIEKRASSQDELWRRFHHRHDEEEKGDDRDRFFQLRQCLNLVFIVLTIVGVAMWFAYSHDMASYVIIVGIVFKFAEASLRLVKI